MGEVLAELERNETLLKALGRQKARELLAVRRAKREDLGKVPGECEIAAYSRSRHC